MKLENFLIKKTIKIGIIGIGSMGKGLAYQSHITPGIECVAVCDTNVERCIDVVHWLGQPYQVVSTVDAMHEAIRRGLVAVCQGGELVSCCELIDAVIDASNAIGSAAYHALEALEHRKHLILMNSEIDLMFGPLFAHRAAQKGVVYTSCDGDQYGVMKHLIDALRFWGFDLVMAGNIKGFLDRYANPTTIVPEADKRHLDYRMCTSYTDGTKLNIEMAIIANACGLATRIPGMYGPQAGHVEEVFRCFDLDMLWEGRMPFVDYIIGAEPAGGVFAIGHCENPYQREMLSYYKMGEGPYYLFYRPYHLCHIEAMKTVIDAVSLGRHFLRPDHGLQTNVYAYAKIDLQAGQTLDGVGGYACYGKIENLKDNQVAPGLPICLADRVVLQRALVRDERIAMTDIAYGSGRKDFALYQKALGLTAGIERG
jgi:predicted homoserine dehydrogenase-like protein